MRNLRLLVASALAMVLGGGCAWVVGADFDPKHLSTTGSSASGSTGGASSSSSSTTDGAGGSGGCAPIVVEWAKMLDDTTIAAITAVDDGLVVAGSCNGASMTCGTQATACNHGSFAAKFDDTGACKWSVSFVSDPEAGPSGFVDLNDVAADPSHPGGVAVIGDFTQSILAGDIEISAPTDSPQALVVLLDKDGGVTSVPLATNSAGSSAASSGVVTANGDIMLVGFFDGNWALPTGTLSAPDSGPLAASYALRVKRDGMELWATTSDYVQVQRVALGPGDALVKLSDYDDFDGTGANTIDVLYGDNAGQLDWTVGVGKAHEVAVTGIAAPPSGAVYAAGFFAGSLDFAGKHKILSVDGSYDFFLAAFDNNGNATNAAPFGDSTVQPHPNYDGYPTLAWSGNDLVVTGALSGTTDFGCGVLSASSTETLFVARFDAQLKARASALYPGSDPARALRVTAASNGAVYVAGTFSGELTLGHDQLQAQSSMASFLVRLPPAL